MSEVKIISDGTAKGTKIYIDHELQKDVTALNLGISLDKLPELVLKKEAMKPLIFIGKMKQADEQEYEKIYQHETQTANDLRKRIKELEMQESYTFLSYMLLANAISGYFKTKKMNLEEMKELAFKLEDSTRAERRKLWKEYMGSEWE